ncbi:MAG TPA: hypothetical protein VK072_06700 [Candidatus Avamphibacillus sp.]|nr:hypothetical protein [Candidatus Avamphibacillus sp.]
MISYIVMLILIMAGIIALFLIFFRYISSKIMPGARHRWLLIGYVTILLLAFGISYTIPGNEIDKNDRLKIVHDQDIPNLYAVPEFTGSIDIAQDYLTDEWTFDFDEETLHLEIFGEDMLNNIAIETTKEKQTIDVNLYVTPSILNNIDFTTGSLPKTDVTLHDNVLTVETPSRNHVEVSQLQKPFPVRQFTESNYLNVDIEPGFSVSEEVDDTSVDSPYIDMDGGRIFSTELLYLKVPANVKVTGTEDMNIFFID